LEQITLKLETFGWIAVWDRICAIVGPNQHREKQLAEPIWRSPNVKIERKFDEKNNRQLLYGFLTRFFRESFQVKITEKRNIQHASLIVGKLKQIFQTKTKKRLKKS
jgi:hypothetical protein